MKDVYKEPNLKIRQIPLDFFDSYYLANTEHIWSYEAKRATISFYERKMTGLYVAKFDQYISSSSCGYIAPCETRKEILEVIAKLDQVKQAEAFEMADNLLRKRQAHGFKRLYQNDNLE